MVALSVAHAASLRSPLLTALRCCQLVLLSVVGGATDGMACYWLALMSVVGGALVLVSVALLM